MIMKNPLILWLLIASASLQLASCNARTARIAVEAAEGAAAARTAAHAAEEAAAARAATHATEEAAAARRAAQATEEAAAAARRAVQPSSTDLLYTQVTYNEQDRNFISLGQINLLPADKREIYNSTLESTLNHMALLNMKVSLNAAQEIASIHLQEYNQKHGIIMGASTVTFLSSSIGVAAYNTAYSSSNSG